MIYLLANNVKILLLFVFLSSTCWSADFSGQESDSDEDSTMTVEEFKESLNSLLLRFTKNQENPGVTQFFPNVPVVMISATKEGDEGNLVGYESDDSLSDGYGEFINCSLEDFCEPYCRKFVEEFDTIKKIFSSREKFVKNVLKTSGKYIVSDQDILFYQSEHGESFDPDTLTHEKLPICSGCRCHIRLNSIDTIKNFDRCIRTKFGDQHFGLIYYGSTPLWENVYKTVERALNAGQNQKFDFLEVASGFNSKPIIIWIMSQGRINCVINDINTDNCGHFLERMYFLDPSAIKDCHKNAAITLHRGDFLEQQFSKNGNRYDFLVITNFFHYLPCLDRVALAMDEIVKITKPGAIVFLQALSGKDMVNDYEQGSDYAQPIFTPNHPQILSYFPRSALKKLASDYGFLVMDSGEFYMLKSWFAWVQLKKS